MTRRRSIWLVARREVIERGRSRGFILSMLFTTALIIGSFLVPTLLFGDDDATVLGVATPAPPGLEEAIAATADRFGTDVRIERFESRASGEAAVRDGAVALLVAVPDELSGPGEITFHDSTDPTLEAIVGNAVVSLRVNAVLTDSGVDPEAYVAAQAPPAGRVLEPRTDGDQAGFLFANLGTILIFIGIFSFGFTVLSGVVEEKQSRVVEVVLATVRPRDLLMGKVLGIGVLGIVQLALFVVAGGATAVLTDRFTLPATTPAAIGQLVLWFVLGYTLYATALGFLGALASRMEEASNASTPVTLFATVSYLLALFAVSDDPSGLVARVATFFPPSAPMVVPMRAALGAIEPWEILASVGVMVIAIYALFVVGGRVYSGAVLQTAGRMKLRDAWRSAGE